MFGRGAFDKRGSQTHDDCVVKNAKLRAARPDSPQRKARWFGIIKLHDQMSRRGNR